MILTSFFPVCRRVLPNSLDLLERPMFRLVIYWFQNPCTVFLISILLVTYKTKNVQIYWHLYYPLFFHCYMFLRDYHFLFPFAITFICVDYLSKKIWGFCALMTPGWRAKEIGCAFKWCFCQGSDKQWPNCESLENCWCLFNWTHSDSFLRVWIFFQCILVSEEDELATFVEPSNRGRSFCLPSAVWSLSFV